jgi:hypothetical protein
MRSGDVMIPVLDEMEIFDQEIRPAGLAAEKLSNILECVIVELAPFGKASGAFP